MTNQRSVMTEFRALDQKRQTAGLTPDEASRLAQLRELVGPEPSAPRSGFDVNAAAARLRESLLPAGLRNRPAGMEPPPPPPPAPEPPPAAEPAWVEPAAEPPPAPSPALFDPASLGREVKPQAWNPEMPGYDPDAPYDEEAWIAAGYDPNATYDWSAYGYGPDGQPLAEGAAVAAEEPQAEPFLEPAEAQPPEAAWAEPAASLEPAAAPSELASPWSEEAAPADASPEPTPQSGAAWTPEPAAAEPGWAGESPSLEVEFTPGPMAIPGGPAMAGAAVAMEPAGDDWGEVTVAQPELEPLELAGPTLPARADAAAAGADQAELAPPAAPWSEPDVPVTEATPEPVRQVAAPVFGEYEETGGAVALPPTLDLVGQADLGAPEAGALSEGEPAAEPGIQPHLPAPAGAPFGEYDEAGTAATSDAALVAMLPFDPAAASAIGPDSMPEGYEVSEPGSLEQVGADIDQAAMGPDSMYGGPDGDSLPGGPPLDVSDVSAEWQPETALDQGFELASEGSFGHEELAPVGSSWSPPTPPPQADPHDLPPALDLAASFEPSPLEPEVDAPPFPAAPPEATPPELALPPIAPPVFAPPAAPPPEVAGDDLPTIEGEEILEELTPEAVAAAPWEPEPAVSYGHATEEGVPPEIATAYAQPRGGPPFQPPPAAVAALGAPRPAPAPLAPPPPPGPEPMEAEPLPPPAPTALIEGTHRVVLHTVDGQVKRGLLVDALLDAELLTLQPQGPGASEALRTDSVKAIFFMLAAGEKAPTPEGKKVRVTFRDGRQVAGYSPDYQDGLVGFFMIPADTRTNTGRIWVYQAAVRQVSVS